MNKQVKTGKSILSETKGESVANHTPTPWALDDNGWCEEAELHENQPIIVRAVNEYDGLKEDNLKALKVIASDTKEIVTLTEQRDALLEAAKIGLGILESDYTGRGGRDLSGGALKTVKAAIALAEGGGTSKASDIAQAEGGVSGSESAEKA